jgi:hypothetical protein
VTWLLLASWLAQIAATVALVRACRSARDEASVWRWRCERMQELLGVADDIVTAAAIRLALEADSTGERGVVQ